MEIIMAHRPIFIPLPQAPFVKEVQLEFAWFPGFSLSQTQKSILSLHEEARDCGYQPVLEISSKSPNLLGVDLSAFNLKIQSAESGDIPVECAFQGSKVFENGGPYTDLYLVTSSEAKKEPRLQSSGRVVKFVFGSEVFPAEPYTLFYHWLYLHALSQHPHMAEQLTEYCAFSDIAFNPLKSVNCQARSAALYLGLKTAGLLDRAINDHDWLRIVLHDHQ
jgi:hypothetical protein